VEIDYGYSTEFDCIIPNLPYSIFIFSCRISKQFKTKKQIKKMQNQINKLCRLTGNAELASTYLSKEKKELILDSKNTGKTMESIKKIRELRDLSLKKSCFF